MDFVTVSTGLILPYWMGLPIRYIQKIMKKDFIEGAKAAIPIILGYIPVGIAYGMMAKATGLTFFKALSFSLFVYTGAGQMAAVTMLAQNAAYVTIVFTVLY